MTKKKIDTLAREIVTDPKFLSQVCSPVGYLQDNEELDEIVTSLVDTYRANLGKCVGLAANQIGFQKRVILVQARYGFIIMINPKVKPVSFYGKSRKKEICLSFPGKESKVTRYKRIIVEYDTYSREPIDRLTRKYTGAVARIIQHEMDHLNGKLM